MTTPERKDPWSSGHAYEPYLGHWSRFVARELVGSLGVPAGLYWIGASQRTDRPWCAPQAVAGLGPRRPRRGYQW